MSEKVDDCIRSILVRELAHAKFIIADAKILALQGGMAINVMARTYGNVERVSMAKPRTKKQQEEAQNITVTNATAGRPGVAATANKTTKQTTLFRRRG